MGIKIMFDVVKNLFSKNTTVEETVETVEEVDEDIVNNDMDIFTATDLLLNATIVENTGEVDMIIAQEAVEPLINLFNEYYWVFPADDIRTDYDNKKMHPKFLKAIIKMVNKKFNKSSKLTRMNFLDLNIDPNYDGPQCDIEIQLELK